MLMFAIKYKNYHQHIHRKKQVAFANLREKPSKATFDSIDFSTITTIFLVIDKKKYQQQSIIKSTFDIGIAST